ncbi:E3 SUMO- ligase KIAA1586-like [Pelobates cultripes]|uniref:E3 SUMO- ligase KIAA1586-like n=1 Tax=Pelobates cultripes TaxID=61616 RepID=A0AAD1RRP7_PELCU|nr:E3 SUMO- ligase KIAA1586-like [Pelobates cultripes]
MVTDVAEDADVSDNILPECWDQNQWLEFKKKYPWLFVDNGLLGCKVCREVKHLGVSVSQGVSISKEWSTGVADAVQEMGLLSEALQRDDITLPRAYQLINRSVRAVEKMKDMPGKHLKEIMESLEKGNFKGVTINPESTKGQRWPINVDSPWFEGEAKLEQLCKRFRLRYASICEGFRDYIDNGGADIPKNLKPVVTAVNSLPVTSGDCERGFSTINLVMSPIRSGLGIERLSSLLFISLIGPPVHLWDPLPYVTKWLTTHRSADDTKSRKVDNLARQGQRYSSLWNIF